MKVSDYAGACWNLRNEFDASPEALAHLAFCNVNSLLVYETESLRKARADYAAEASEWNFDRLERRRRELLVRCQVARMLIAASRAERLGYTECTVNATQEDIERYLEIMDENARLQHELDMQAFDDMRVPHHESCLCAGCAASIEYV